MKILLVLLIIATIGSAKPFSTGTVTDSNFLTPMLNGFEMKPEDVPEFMKGFLEGLNERGDINDLLKCLNDLEKIIMKIMEALEYIKKGDPLSLVKGITMLIQCVTEMIFALMPCMSGYEQLKKLFEALDHIDIMKVVFKFLSNPEPLVRDVVDCMEAFRKSDYRGAGRALGDFLLILFLKDADEINFQDVVDILKGFLKSINQAHNFDNLEACILEIPIVISSIKNVIELMRNIDWKNLDKLLEALIAIFSTFKEVLQAIKPCSKIPSEINTIVQKIKNIDPGKLLAKLLSNIMGIIQDITQAIESLRKHSYNEFGKKIGNVLFVLVLKDD